MNRKLSYCFRINLLLNEEVLTLDWIFQLPKIQTQGSIRKWTLDNKRIWFRFVCRCAGRVGLGVGEPAEEQLAESHQGQP